MEEQKKIKIRGIIIFIFVACAVFAAAFFVSKIQKLPSIQEQNGIEVIEQSDQKIVRNIAEGYQVTVPREWEVPEVYLPQEKIRVDKYGPNQKLETELQDGVVLSVYIKDNLENLSIDDWAKKYWQYSSNELISIKIFGTTILKTIEKVIYAEDEQGNPLYIEDSEQVDLSLINNGKYYNFSCESVGQEYQKYSQECEKIVTENIQELVK